MGERKEEQEKEPEHVAPELWADVQDVRAVWDAYLQGWMSEDEFRRFRIHRGIYGQRQPDVYMVRLKLPLGQATADQLRHIAAISREFADGRAHLTTRQDIQIYFIPTRQIPTVIARLAAAGLSTREACGNTVRNVTVCPRAGLCPEEHFDVTPYADAVRRYFLRHPLVQNLPRKFKIAFSGCKQDCAFGGIHDIGLIALPRTGEAREGKGFRMVIGGGLGPMPELAQPLRPFVPAAEVLPLCEAVIRVFDAQGERRNRSRARLKFLKRRIGMEALAHLIEMERQTLRGTYPPVGEAESATAEPPALAPTPWPTEAAFATWAAQSVVAQKQAGYCLATAYVPKGDLTAEQLIALAEIAERYGRGVARVTQEQNLSFPWVPSAHIPALYRALQAAGLAEPYAGTLADITACPAAASCKSGITRTKDAADRLAAALKPLAHAQDLRGVAIKMSGCPNSCGQHHLGGIGLHGAAATVEGKKAPCYEVLVGGRGRGGVVLARRIGRVPACRVDRVVLRLIDLYRQHREEGEGFHAFYERASVGWLRVALQDVAEMRVQPGEEECFFRDIGDRRPFRIETGEGECAA